MKSVQKYAEQKLPPAYKGNDIKKMEWKIKMSLRWCCSQPINAITMGNNFQVEATANREIKLKPAHKAHAMQTA